MGRYNQIYHDDSKHLTTAKRDTANGVCGIDALKEVVNDVPVSKLVDMSEQSFENLLDNGDFKLWNAGDSSAPGGWTITNISAALESSIVKIGDYSAKFTSTGTDKVEQLIPNYERYKGVDITLQCWVYSSIAGKAAIQISDGVTSDTSSTHTGNSTWELLTITKTLSGSANALKVRLYPDLDSGTELAYFDGAILVEGSICPAFSPKPQTDVHTYGEMYIYNNSNATVIETADTPIAIRQISDGLNNGFIFHAGSTGTITAYADYSGTVAGTVLVTDAGHGLSTGDIITIRGTTNYNGIFAVTVVSVDTFYITDTWVNDNGASDWDQGASLTAQPGTDGVYTSTWQMTASPAGACRAIFFININTTPQIKSGAPRELAINDEDNNSSTCLMEIVAGDVIWLSVQSDNTTDITHTYGNINIERKIV